MNHHDEKALNAANYALHLALGAYERATEDYLETFATQLRAKNRMCDANKGIEEAAAALELLEQKLGVQ